MGDRIFYALFTIGGLALGYYVIVWFLGAIGIQVPTIVLRIILALVVLFAIWILYRLFAPVFPGWPGAPPPA